MAHIFVSSRLETGTSNVVVWSIALFMSRERWQGKQVENKELRFEEAAKGKHERIRVCITMKTTDLKWFVLHSI